MTGKQTLREFLRRTWCVVRGGHKFGFALYGHWRPDGRFEQDFGCTRRGCSAITRKVTDA